MSTRRLYYDDAYLQNFDARVISCNPSTAVFSEAGPIPAWEAILDATAFYPTSGGQPHDTGVLGGATVLDVRDSGEDVVHILDRDLPEAAVSGCVSWPRRFDHMQQHTGQHLLSAMFQERFGLPTVSFHLGAEICTIDLRGPEPSTDVLLGAQRAANRVIFEDRPIAVRYGTAEEFARLGVRKEVEREGLLRAIEIESADLQPCGGTHVRSTGQIGLILVRRCTKMRQDWRVEFVCGGRADRLATSDFQALRALSDRLGAAPAELLPATDKLFAERDAHFKSLRASIELLAEARASLLVAASVSISGGRRLVVELLRDAPADLLLPLATRLAAFENTIALLALESSGQLVFAQNPAAGADLAAISKRVFDTYSGKGGGSRDFVRAKLNAASDSSAALALAKSLLA